MVLANLQVSTFPHKADRQCLNDVHYFFSDLHACTSRAFYAQYGRFTCMKRV